MVEGKNDDQMDENLEAEDVSSEEVEVEESSDEIKERDEEIQSLKDQLIRLQADFMNFKRRSEEAKISTMDYAIEKFVCDLLPCMDNFERALDSSEDKDNPFYQGVLLIYEELNKVLDRNNVKEIEALGQDFDPNMHHAVLMEDSEDYDEGKVTEVLQKGYKIKEKVVRPSMVKVAN